MGDMGIGKWTSRMKLHQLKGHYIIKYDTSINMANEIELFIKNKSIWEQENFPNKT